MDLLGLKQATVAAGLLCHVMTCQSDGSSIRWTRVEGKERAKIHDLIHNSR